MTGSELLIEGVPERLVLRSINSARSAFLAVTLSAQFFESYNLFAPTGLVQAAVLLKHLLATFRSSRVSSMSLELNPELALLSVTLKCDNGLLKRYGIDLTASDILQATLDGDDLPVSVVAEAAELNSLLNTFQSSLDEITIIAQPEHEPQDSTAAAAAAAQKAVQIKSFLDPTKGSSSSSLQTCLQLNSQQVFRSYSHSGSSPSDVTVNLKDLKALVALCCELNADVALRFDKAGLPLLAVPYVRGAQEVAYTAELILATLQESQILDDEWTEGGAAAAAGDGAIRAPNGVHHGNAGAADAAETIAPATTFATHGGAAAAGGGGDVTPQGGVGRPPSIIRFNDPAATQQQQQQQQLVHGEAAAAAGGRSGGGVSGGRFNGGGFSGAASSGRSRGSGLSRLQRLEAEEEAEQGGGGVGPYSRLTSSMAAAAARSGGAAGAAATAAGGGAGGVFSGAGAAAGLRSPVGGADRSRGTAFQQQQQAEPPPQQQQWQQWQQQGQQQGQSVGYASASLGEYAAAAARYQGAAAAVGGGSIGGDSEADDPEALPGFRRSVQHAYHHQRPQQTYQQDAYGQDQEFLQPGGYQEQHPLQQQQQTVHVGYQQQQTPDDESEELLPSEDEGMQDADGADFGML